MRVYVTLGLLLLTFFTRAQSGRVTISGYVRESGSGESLPGVTVSVPAVQKGTTTNTYGFYSLTLPLSDTLEVVVSSIGFQSQSRKLALTRNLEMNWQLLVSNAELKEVVVSGNYQTRESQKVQMSTISVPIEQMKDVPALLGEKDMLKVLQLLPGVQKGSEGNSGLYIRGGGPDQNLLILDEAPVYNAFHLFGFFSIFNGDALKSVELIKGGFPARYGGRLSSVIEMQMKEGHKEEFHGEGGIGLISSRLVLQGPIQKNKSSFIISGRRTYVDILLKPLLPAENQGSYYFYDLNAKLNYDFGRKDKVYLSGYLGQDRFSFRSQIRNNQQGGGLDWGNKTASLRWNHLFSNRLFANTTLLFSHYAFQVNAQSSQTFNNLTSQFNLQNSSTIRDFTFKTDFDWSPIPQHSIKTGLSVTSHRFLPNTITLENSIISQNVSQIQPLDSYEGGIYLEDTYHPFSALRINAGLRMSYFATEGRTYNRPEPRLALSYTFPRHWALKASYATMNQYIHLLSNSSVGLPTDLWVPTTRNVAPQQSQQIALGVAKDYSQFSVTIEGFYKKMDNILSYKEGSSFLASTGLESLTEASDSRSWEEQITAGQGWSYGSEFFVQKKTGRLTGWVGYTLSWIQNQFAELNGGKKFWARYDRRHDISVVGIYHLKPTITLSSTWVYGTGQAISLPQSTFEISGPTQPGFVPSFPTRISDYGQRNSFRAAPYHRLDVGIQFHKKKKRFSRTWEVSLYNAYSRKNPFFYYIDDSQSTPTRNNRVLTQVSLFPIIPSVSYSFKF
ncbi:TonB-dependent receptor [Siphonobacter sp. SORGH_AS_0500]|uniref:TonB-dependent receptor n=1 Tax=Siphonobacter sp. SORGH_AS_0500 TaxID=1864824 RepID=UPI000CBE8C9A|nr:TonB-dependent receptor [Siphonobacter sp. SORGH_AS_0500]PKK36455.1 TonB-dependent receptor [Siphonobacter sp. SORGH_AS_0500]